MKDRQGKENQDDIREPGVQYGEVQTFGNVVGVKELKDVEMEKVEAVAALADQEQGAPGEDCRDGVGATETENEGGEDRRHEATVHQEIRSVVDQGVEEEADCREAQRGEDEALAWRDGEGVLELAEGDAGEEGADVGEGGVLEEAEELG